ncbi:ECF RNA polymerase sigma factor SigE [Actinomadura rubteroloni]|uniref:ECF RNA polymerase sigma factor SigE n=1 Tax=Actinomadura rubteroloni TaxID=1926885 RepID=A0A2P4UDL0_9ACTN|nr:RNA polymerase sigma factor [Actinomadura rubteroloni]POM23134.1 ECF RNA polymerase sigma factor SigE [Actinomadura rubteroloni]
MEDATEDELGRAVAAAAGGDEDAFRLLYRDVQPRLLRYARALAGSDAEDVTAEAWLQIARDIAGFQGEVDAFRGWCATIVRNRALDLLRRRSRRPVADRSLEEVLSMPAREDTEALALARLSTDAAVRLIAELPPDQAEAVLLRVVVGLDAERAGRVLGKRAGAVRTAAYRGLRRLAARLDTAPDTGAAPVRTHTEGAL